jgi:hypothetical protein
VTPPLCGLFLSFCPLYLIKLYSLIQKKRRKKISEYYILGKGVGGGKERGITK